METSDKLLEVDKLVKVFSFGSLLSRQKFTAVDEISFHIAPAEIFALAGERLILTPHVAGAPIAEAWQTIAEELVEHVRAAL